MKQLLFLFAIFFVVSCSSGIKNKDTDQQSNQKADMVETTVKIGGMHCDMCVASIEKGVNELDGVASVEVSLSDSSAVVSYDASKLDLTKIGKAIEKRGYSVKK